MRTIEEIRQDIKKSDDSVGIVRGYEYLNLFMELAQAQDAEIARLRLQCEWQPIETAPKDGTVIELYSINFEYPYICRWIDIQKDSILQKMNKMSGFYSVETNKLIENSTHWRSIPEIQKGE